MKKRIVFPTGILMIMAACLGLFGCGDSLYSGINFDDYIKVGEYKGLSVEDYEIKVSDDDVQAKIDQALEAAGKETELSKGDEIKNGDKVNIDFVGKIDGKEFEGGSSEGYELEIGSNSFIEGFEDGLIGKKVGDEESLDLQFPEDYNNAEVAGKDVVFEVTINSAKRTETPKYNDKFVKSNTKYATTKEYEESLKKTIRKEKKEEADNQQKSQLWSQVMETTEMKKYPEDKLKEYVDNFSAQIDKTAEQAGMKRSDVIAQYGLADEKALQEMLKESAEGLIKQEMAIEYIADKEGLDYTSDEKDSKIKEIETMGYTEETVQEQTGRTMDEYVHVNLLYEKVVDFILKNAKVEKK